MRRALLLTLFACTPTASTSPTPAGPAPAPEPVSTPAPAAVPTPSPAAAAGSPGCGRAASPGARTAQITALGKPRSFLLVVPAGYDPRSPYPVVFGLHGNGGTAAGVRGQLDLERAAAGRAIFVYPQALGGGWDLDGETGKNRDVALFDSILLELHGSLCVDERRIFVTGFSNGAYMANQLGCRRGERIRAVASHAGGGPYENAGRYDEQGHLLCPGKSVASLVVHGLADNGVSPSEGQKSIDHWSFANRCGAGWSKVEPSPCLARSGCYQPVVACKVPGLGHAVWPEGKRLTWSFFDALR